MSVNLLVPKEMNVNLPKEVSVNLPKEVSVNFHAEKGRRNIETIVCFIHKITLNLEQEKTFVIFSFFQIIYLFLCSLQNKYQADRKRNNWKIW